MAPDSAYEGRVTGCQALCMPLPASANIALELPCLHAVPAHMLPWPSLALQAMIKEGLIDLDGFDDFRVVIGENSLVQR